MKIPGWAMALGYVLIFGLAAVGILEFLAW
jgi:hypothetical protein